ncbi:hypothetical protein MCUN1_003065 [Malassezia cuniculi]|uniref:Calnexin n=1 Tax=Malassezia cuniculi TaxID=948313 RepID=A0AAF0F0V1_9BASI|nr:hypothetical protein MCUN1_003065 [Malassezia cuniculi]
MVKPLAAAAAAATASIAVLLCAGSVEARASFTPTKIKAPFLEQFTNGWEKRWSPSKASKLQRGTEEFKYDGEWAVEEPTVFPGLAGDKGLVLKSKAKQHAISAKFAEPMTFDGTQPLVVQYEVKMQKGLSCGGAYIKLLSDTPEGINSAEFSDTTPYTIMFGPDRCGTNNKVHFIFRHQNPTTGDIEEKHLEAPPFPKISKTTTLYTLIVNPDNTYEILINLESKKKGSLLEDFEPPVNPPEEIDDPTDEKPADWVDEPRIPDPTATKPDDWDEDAPVSIVDTTATKPDDWYEDEPLQIPDPDAVKPEEWDDEEDGEWTPPLISNPLCETNSGCGKWLPPLIRNPAYKGKWSAPLIDNPAYKGEWAPRKIRNPAFFVDNHPNRFTPIAGVGFELWSLDADILFDNVYVGHSIKDANKLAQETFVRKLPIERNVEISESIDKEERKWGAIVNPSPLVVRYKLFRKRLDNFIERLQDQIEKPSYIIKDMWDVPATLAAAVAAILVVIGTISAILGRLFGRKSPQPKAKTEPAAAADAGVAAAKSSAVATGSESTTARRNIAAK